MYEINYYTYHLLTRILINILKKENVCRGTHLSWWSGQASQREWHYSSRDVKKEG